MMCWHFWGVNELLGVESRKPLEIHVDTLTVNRLVSPIKTEKEGLRAFIGWLALQADNSVVLLLDEYDTPLTTCLNKPELFDEVRKKLWRLYAAFKQWDGAIRFFFMTGVAKFSQTSIFSELNHFTDISLMSEFGSLLGYSHQEVQKYFSGYLEQASFQLGIEKEKLLEELTLNYDGFCFERTATQRVFSPWSLLKFLNFPLSGSYTNLYIASQFALRWGWTGRFVHNTRHTWSLVGNGMV